MNYMEVMTNFTKFPKKKKKKKKRGGGKVYSRSGRDFQCLCSFKLTSGIVIKVFPFSKGKTFMYFV